MIFCPKTIPQDGRIDFKYLLECAASVAGVKDLDKLIFVEKTFYKGSDDEFKRRNRRDAAERRRLLGILDK